MPSCHAHLPPIDLERPSAVRVLYDEHIIILGLLDALDRMAEHAMRSQGIPVRDARDAIEVIRGFADEYHHAKEERLLFPVLDRLSPGFGPTRVMRHEHDLGRDHVRGMAIAVEAIDVNGFVHECQSFSDLLRAHIHKENEVLFPMAQALLSSDDDAALLAAYRDADRDSPCARMLMRIESLLVAYGTANQCEPQRAACGCNAADTGHCQ